MSRALRIELRRSTALALALAVVVVSAGAEVLAGDYTFWAGSWALFTSALRSTLLALLCALAVGGGAMQAGRDHRRGVLDLIATAPRPRRQRVLPAAAALALAAVTGYLVVFAACAAWLAPLATYANPPAIAAVVGVGALAMLAAVWLGMLVGHLLPSRLTPPIVTVLTLLGLTLGPEGTGPAHPLASQVALLLPVLREPSSATAAVPGHLSALQALWMLAVAVTALGAFAATRYRARLLAVLPMALALVVVVPQLPDGPGTDAAYAIDPQAAQLVCATGAPRVCVTRVHAALLPQITGPARRALTALGRLPQPPTAVVEYPLRRFGDGPPPSGDTLWLVLDSYFRRDARGLLLNDDLQTLTSDLIDEGTRRR